MKTHQDLHEQNLNSSELIQKKYLETSVLFKQKISAFVLALLAITYIILNLGEKVRYSKHLLKTLIIISFTIIFLDTISSFFSSEHYRKLIDRKQKIDDFRRTWQGKICEVIFYVNFVLVIANFLIIIFFLASIKI